MGLIVIGFTSSVKTNVPDRSVKDRLGRTIMKVILVSLLIDKPTEQHR